MVSGWGGGDVLLGEGGVDEVVDGLGGVEGGEGLEGPPLFAALEYSGPVGFFGELFFGRWVIAGVGGTGGDPLFEVGEDVGVEFGAVFGHFEIGVFVADGLEEERCGGVAGDEGRAGVAAGLPAGARVEEEAAFLLGGGAMAFVAFLSEDGADAGLEEFELLGCRGGDERAERNEKGRKKNAFHARSLWVMVWAAWAQA